MLGGFLNRCINKGGHGLRLDPLDWKKSMEILGEKCGQCNC